eukprot:1093122-Prymnesium_polylepis.1
MNGVNTFGKPCELLRRLALATNEQAGDGHGHGVARAPRNPRQEREAAAVGARARRPEQPGLPVAAVWRHRRRRVEDGRRALGEGQDPLPGADAVGAGATASAHVGPGVGEGHRATGGRLRPLAWQLEQLRASLPVVRTPVHGVRRVEAVALRRARAAPARRAAGGGRPRRRRRAD